VLTTTAGWVDPSAPVVGSLLDKHRDDANLIIFGVLIIAVLIFRPDGLVGAWKSLRATVRRWPYSS
jgi:ABC-type branched-subunit amino acid transport system permease subunit